MAKSLNPHTIYHKNSASNDRTVENLHALFDAALVAANPAECIRDFLPKQETIGQGRLVIVGAGKASMAMAIAAENFYLENGVQPTGIIVTPHGATMPTKGLEVIEARHPVPDQSGVEASIKILDLATQLTSDDTLLCLISGGGSALLSAPLPPLGLEDKQAVNKSLLSCGAAIDEMNAVRKCLSQIKGGRLASAAAPARVVTLLVSDVPGDDPQIIASGPTVASSTGLQEARNVIERYGLSLPKAVENAMASPQAQPPEIHQGEISIIAKPQKSLEAAATMARDLGYEPLVLGDALEGEARELGSFLAGITKQVLNYHQPKPAPLALISGGETTVTLTAESGKWGKGGRNAECLLGFAAALETLPAKQRQRISALFCDTDGKDGSEENAGAFWTNQHYDNASQQGLSLQSYLQNNDAYSLFQACEALVETGPTFTNVNDFRVVLID